MDKHDDELVARLRTIVGELEPVPRTVVAAARDAIAMRDLDGELAALVADSEAAVPELRFEEVRASTAQSRLLLFEGAGVRVDAEVMEQAGQVTVVGRLIGAAPRDCFLEMADGAVREVLLDDLGRFLIEAVPPGLARLRCRSAGGGRVTTDWTRL